MSEGLAGAPRGAGGGPNGERVVAVFGSARLDAGDPEYEEARELGALLAGAGFTVKTGGYYGAMEAVSRGAHEAGGHVVGITLRPFSDRRAPNGFVREEQEAGDLFARVQGLVHSDAWIAVSGGVGTLAEVAITWNLLQHEPELTRPLVLMGPRWRALLPKLMEHLVVDDADAVHVRAVDGPADALRAVGEALASGPAPGPPAEIG